MSFLTGAGGGAAPVFTQGRVRSAMTPGDPRTALMLFSESKRSGTKKLLTGISLTQRLHDSIDRKLPEQATPWRWGGGKVGAGGWGVLRDGFLLQMIKNLWKRTAVMAVQACECAHNGQFPVMSILPPKKEKKP